MNDRLLVEQGFKRGDIKVLCCTSTLAVGVNLPAYLVVIKGTKTWTNMGLMEYSELDVLQMMGRAGRPQFEDEGAGVIMTDDKRKDKYENLVKGTQKLESSLYLCLHETFTAEIALNTITSLESAYEWLCSTFFYQRFLKNPTSYPTVYGMTRMCQTSQEKLTKLAELIMDDLIKESMVIYENINYKATAYGLAMANHYVMFDTMKELTKTDKNLSLSQMIRIVSSAKEFKEIRLKHSEKRLYKEINSSPLVMFPKKDNKVSTNEDKISLLIQFELGGLEYPTYKGAMKLHSTFLSDKMITVFHYLP
ncbi:unnamed protein product [Ambrosiozyma monospora]|uniref:Unnamed protein product n=1 Tax=Ambrosiozyma monospora TaxID=43982 RepID=A0ACB5U1W5_AMBMO|nr:unnamed protein product [Ambrosiozyma monospora]